MGLFAHFVVGRDDGSPVPPDARAWSGAAPGWRLWEYPLSNDPAVVAARATTVPGPVIGAVVFDSDVAIVLGGGDGHFAWRWVVNPETFARMNGQAFDEAAVRAADKVAADAIGSWTAAHATAVTPGDLADLLDSGHILAEEGLFGLLSLAGILDPEAELAPVPAAAASGWAPGTQNLRRGASFEASRPERDPWHAAPLLHDSARWHQLRAQWELEAWGEPAAIVVQPVRMQVTRDGAVTFESRSYEVYLATDPPIGLGSHMVEPGAMWQHDLPIGVWRQVPLGADADPVAAAAWAREHVGTQGQAPRPDRPRLGIEVYGDAYRSEFGWQFQAFQAAAAEVWAVILRTTLDLLSVRRPLAEWADRFRAQVLVPIMAAGNDVSFNPDGTGAPFGLNLSAVTWSMKDQLRTTSGDDASWATLLTGLEQGRFRELTLALRRLNGQGQAARYPATTAQLSIDLREPRLALSVATSLLEVPEGKVIRAALTELTTAAVADFQGTSGSITAAAGGVQALAGLGLVADPEADDAVAARIILGPNTAPERHFRRA